MVIGALVCCLHTNAHAERIAPNALYEDERLAAPVTVSASDISLGQLLGNWSKQTGVAISIDPRDSASSCHLLAECDKVAASKMMDALYRLVSRRGGEWAWNRTGKPGHYEYELSETFAAKNRTESFRRLQLGLLDRFIAAMRSMAAMTPEERRRRRGDLERALLLEKTDGADFFFTDDWFWIQAAFFFGATTPEQQRALLNGGSITVNIKSLAPAVVDAFRRDVERYTPPKEDLSDAAVRRQEPESVTFRAHPAELDMGTYAPTIVATGIMPVGATSYLGTGHLSMGVRVALESLWFLPGDEHDDPASMRLVPASPATDLEQSTRPDRAAESPEELARRRQRGPAMKQIIRTVAQSVHIPVLAIVDARSDRAVQNPVGAPVSTFLANIHGWSTLLFVKWHSGVLMVCDPRWFAVQEPVIPEYLITKLARDSHGRVTLPDLIDLIRHISRDQAEWLCDHYHIGDYRSLEPTLQLALEYPGVLTPSGTAIDLPAARRMLGNRLLIPNPGSAERDALLFRLRIDAARTSSSRPPWIRIEYFDPDRKSWLPTYGASIDLTIKNR